MTTWSDDASWPDMDWERDVPEAWWAESPADACLLRANEQIDDMVRILQVHSLCHLLDATVAWRLCVGFRNWRSFVVMQDVRLEYQRALARCTELESDLANERVARADVAYRLLERR